MRNEPSIGGKNGEAEDDFLGQKHREKCFRGKNVRELKEHERAEGT